MKKSIFVLALIVLATFNFGCKKNKFLSHNNIIRLAIPENCDGCYILLKNTNNETKGFRHFKGDGTALNSDISYVENGENIYEFELNWEEDIRDVHPTKKITFRLNYPDKVTFNLNSTTPIIEKFEPTDIIVKLKPKNIYNWDPVKNTFEATGEQTEKNEPEVNSNSSSSSSSSDCSIWYKGFYTESNSTLGVDGYYDIQICKVSETSTTVTWYYKVRYNVDEGPLTRNVWISSTLVDMNEFNTNGYTSDNYTTNKVSVESTWNDQHNVWEYHNTTSVDHSFIVVHLE